MACSKLEARGHLLHKTGTPPKQISQECMCKSVRQKLGHTNNLGYSADHTEHPPERAQEQQLYVNLNYI